MEKIIFVLKALKPYLLVRSSLLVIYLKLNKLYTLHINKYYYNAANYADSFLSNVPKSDTAVLKKADEVIYIFWTGNNEISEGRLKGINSLREKSEVKVILITPDNLKCYILEDYPLHPAFSFLSMVHKSDYLRCYFMMHHGGGYSDIKPCLRSWKNLFNTLNSRDDKWCLGVREKYVGGVPDIKGFIGADIKKYHNYLIANGAFIYKPHSPIVAEWINEIHNRLDSLLPNVIKNQGDQYGSGDYPVPWSYIMAQIMHPLILKYSERVIYLDSELYSTENYR